MKIEDKYKQYLLHGVKFILYKDADEFDGAEYNDGKIFKRGTIWELTGFVEKKVFLPIGESEVNGFIFSHENTYANFDVTKMNIRPMLKPLDDILEELADWLFITDVDAFDSRLGARQWCEIMFLNPLELPFNVVNKICSLHGDVFEMIEAGIAVKL